MNRDSLKQIMIDQKKSTLIIHLFQDITIWKKMSITVLLAFVEPENPI